MDHDQIPGTATSLLAELHTILARRQALVRRLQALTPAEPSCAEEALQAYLRRLTVRQVTLLTRLGDLLPPHDQPLEDAA